jgi:hypothetical protein
MICFTCHLGFKDWGSTGSECLEIHWILLVFGPDPGGRGGVDRGLCVQVRRFTLLDTPGQYPSNVYRTSEHPTERFEGSLSGAVH